MKVKRNANGYTLNVSVQEVNRLKAALTCLCESIDEEGVLINPNDYNFIFSKESIDGLQGLIKTLKENC